MRIAVVSGMYPTAANPASGAFVQNLAEALARHGLEQEVLRPTPMRPGVAGQQQAQASRRGPDYGSQCPSPMPSKELPYLHVPVRLSARFDVASIRRQLTAALSADEGVPPVDLIHAHYLYPTGLAAIHAGARLGIPVIVTAHGSDVHTNPGRSRGIARLTRSCIESADQVVAVSRDLARRIERLGAPRSTVRVVRNGVDVEDLVAQGRRSGLRAEMNIPDEAVVVGFVGRFVEAKGIFDLVSALATLAEDGVPVRALFVGSGPDGARLEEAVRSRGLSGAVHIPGSLPHGRIGEAYGAMDVFCLPSHKEGIPVSMLEALALGIPAVVSSVGGIPEVVRDGVEGVLVSAGDVVRLADALVQLFRCPERRQAMGNAGRERIRREFHIERAADQWTELYREVLTRHGKSRGAGENQQSYTEARFN